MAPGGRWVSPVEHKVPTPSNASTRDHKPAIDQLTESLNSLLEAVQKEDWIQLEALEPAVRIALERMQASSYPMGTADAYRKKLKELLLVQQQISDRCLDRMKQISPLLDALSVTKPAID